MYQTILKGSKTKYQAKLTLKDNKEFNEYFNELLDEFDAKKVGSTLQFKNGKQINIVTRFI